MKHIKVEKAWGNELWFANNELYCGKVLTCYKDKWSSEGKFHYHKIKDETFFITSGSLILEVIEGGNANRMLMMPMDSYRVKPNVPHRFKANSPICKFLEVSTTHSDEDSYRISYEDCLKERE